jgi:ketosteroid isomerase-like protein
MSKGAMYRDLRDRVRDMVRLMNERDYKEVSERLSDDVIIVRPTGNPLTKKTWMGMLNSPDVDMKGTSLLEVNNVTLSDSGDMGYVCYTTHAKFAYKGVENDDVAVFVVIFKKIDDVWKITYMQRSSGRKPTDPMPKFN